MVMNDTVTTAAVDSNRTADIVNPSTAPSLPYAIIVGTLLSSIIVSAVIGNTLVVLSVLTNPKLRTITNRFVTSLACADLAVGAIVMPLAVHVEVTGTWSFGRRLCDVWISFDVLLCTASILNLCAISIDRYLSVTRPLQTFTGSWRSRRTANSLIASAWALAVIITCPPLFGWREARRSSSQDVCTLTRDPGYIVYSALGSFYVPLVVMLCLYSKIFRVTRQRLPADGRLREAGREGLDHSTDATPKTPLTQPVKVQSVITTNDHVIPSQTISLNNSSSSSLEVNKIVEISGPNSEWVEMTPVDESNSPTPGRSRIHRVNVPSGRAAGSSASLITKLRSCTVRRASSAPANCSTSIARRSVCSFAHLPCHTDWRGTLDAAIGLRQREVRRENKAAKTLAIVVGGFVVCWLPFFVLYVVEPFCMSCQVSDAVRSLLTWLGYANSLVNPFIYATYNRQFRLSFWKLTVGWFSGCCSRTA